MWNGILGSVGGFLLAWVCCFPVQAQVTVPSKDSLKTDSISRGPETQATVADTAKPVVTSTAPVSPAAKPAAKKDGKDEKKGWSKPKTAAICSAVLPGLGQIYNGRIWKVPIIYAIGGGLGYLAITNNNFYQDFRAASLARTDNNPNTVDPYVGKYTDQGLVVLRDFHRRNRDLSLIFMSFTYLLQILEANVDAHLKGFDVSDDLSLRVSPTLITQNFTGVLPGCRLSITLR